MIPFAPLAMAAPAEEATAEDTTAGDAAVAFIAPVLLAPFVVEWPAGLLAPRAQAPVPVDLELLVDEAGRVEEAAVVAGGAPFAAIALAKARELRFTPASEDGAPIAVRLPVHVEFAPPPLNVEGVILLAGGSRAPAVGLLVRIADQSQLTDADGRFAFRGVRAGPSRLTAGDQWMPVEAQIVEVSPGEAVVLELWARPASLDPGIVGTYRVDRDEVVRRSLTAEEVRTTPGTMGDPLRAISNLPGAVRTPLDSGWLLIRGGDPRNTGVYIDGARVPLIYHLGGFTSVVSPGLVERIDFYPGGQSARYGRATAGAVDLVTRPRPRRVEVRAGANIVHAGAYVAAPIGEGGVTAAVRRSYLDGVLGLVPGITDAQTGVAPRFWDWQVRGDYRNFSLLTLGFVDSIDASTASDEPAAITIQTQRFHGGWHGDLLGKPLLIKPWWAWELYTLTIGVLELTQRQQTNSGGARIELQDDGEGKFGWRAGVDASFSWFNFSFNDIPLDRRIDSPDAYADVRIGEDAKLVFGVRLDTLLVTRQLARAGLSPRASAELPLGGHVTLVADGGVYHQAPPVEILTGYVEGSSFEMERSAGGGGGLRIDAGPVDIDVAAYGRSVSNIAGFEEDNSLNELYGLAFGLETRLRYETGRLSGWFAYSYGHSYRREEPDHVWQPSTYDQPHTANIVSAVDLGRNWTFAGRWRYASGFPLPTGELINAYDLFEQQNVPLIPTYGRTEPFHALDLKISRQALYKAWHLDFYLDVQNVYSRRVAEPVISGVWELYGAQTYGFGLPVLPILGIEGVFGGS